MTKVSKDTIKKVEIEASAASIKRVQATITAIAEYIVDDAYNKAGVSLTVSHEARDAAIKKKSDELTILMKVAPDEFASIIEESFLSMKGKDYIPTKDIKQILTQMDLITKKGALRVSAHKKIASNILRRSQTVSLKDFGIDIEDSNPIDQVKRTLLDKFIGKSLEIFNPNSKRTLLDKFIGKSLGIFNPNSKITLPENKLNVLDRDAYLNNAEYAKQIRSEIAALKKKGVATDEFIRLTIEINKLEKLRLERLKKEVGKQYTTDLTKEQEAVALILKGAAKAIVSSFSLFKKKATPTDVKNVDTNEKELNVLPQVSKENAEKYIDNEVKIEKEKQEIQYIMPPLKKYEQKEDTPESIAKSSDKQETEESLFEQEERQVSLLEKIILKLEELIDKPITISGEGGSIDVPDIGTLPDSSDKDKKHKKSGARTRKPGLSTKGARAGGLLSILTGGLIAYDEYQSAEEDLKAGNITEEEASDKKAIGIGKGVGAAAGGYVGMEAGAALGASIGLVGGPVGALIGGTIGAIAGGIAGSNLGEKIGGGLTESIVTDEVEPLINDNATSLEKKQKDATDAKSAKQAEINATALQPMMNQFTNNILPPIKPQPAVIKDNPRNPDNSLSLFLATRVKII